jgi:hypothetical protein
MGQSFQDRDCGFPLPCRGKSARVQRFLIIRRAAAQSNQGTRIAARGGDTRRQDTRRKTQEKKTKRASHGSWATTLIERRLGCAYRVGSRGSAGSQTQPPGCRHARPANLSVSSGTLATLGGYPTACSNSCSPPLQRERPLSSCDFHPCQNAGPTLLSPHENDHR